MGIKLVLANNIEDGSAELETIWIGSNFISPVLNDIEYRIVGLNDL